MDLVEEKLHKLVRLKKKKQLELRMKLILQYWFWNKYIKATKLGLVVHAITMDS